MGHADDGRHDADAVLRRLTETMGCVTAALLVILAAIVVVALASLACAASDGVTGDVVGWVRDRLPLVPRVMRVLLVAALAGGATEVALCVGGAACLRADGARRDDDDDDGTEEGR